MTLPAPLALHHLQGTSSVSIWWSEAWSCTGFLVHKGVTGRQKMERSQDKCRLIKIKASLLWNLSLASLKTWKNVPPSVASFKTIEYSTLQNIFFCSLYYGSLSTCLIFDLMFRSPLDAFGWHNCGCAAFYFGCKHLLACLGFPRAK